MVTGVIGLPCTAVIAMQLAEIRTLHVPLLQVALLLSETLMLLIAPVPLHIIVSVEGLVVGT
jgi:hypothetical protein